MRRNDERYINFGEYGSLKNQYYVSNDDIKGIIKEEFTGKLKDCKTHFAKKQIMAL